MGQLLPRLLILSSEQPLWPLRVALDFEPVGRWTYQIENVVQGGFDLHEDHTYEATNEQGTWQYSPADRTLTLNGSV